MLGDIIKLSAQGVLSNFLNKFDSYRRKRRTIAVIILVMLYFVLMIFLPAFSLYLSNFIYYPFRAESLFVVLSLALQFIVMAVLSSYFSSLSAKAEFTNTLTNLENVYVEINRLILSDNITKEDMQRVKTLYLDAKQYDLRIDESFKFVPYYFLAMKRTYLLRLQEG